MAPTHSMPFVASARHRPGHALAAALGVLFLSLGFGRSAEVIQRSVTDDAVAVWHMGIAAGEPGERTQLTAHGNVRLGVPLEGPAREASLRRGGDGQVAEFDGGSLVAGEKARGSLRLSGARMTFCIRAPEWWPCTSYWEWNGHYYFTSCGQQWTSPRPLEDPAEKWSSPPHQTLNDGIRVSQTAEFKGRRVMVGFAPEPPNTYFGGELLVRELIQYPDGTLGTRWLPEVIPATGPSMTPPFRVVAGQAVLEGDTIRVRSAEGFAAGAFEGVPQDLRITMRVKAGTGTKHFGLCMRGAGDYASGCELQFEPARQRAQFAPVVEGQMAKEAGNWRAIGGVTGLTELFMLDVIVKDGPVDACVGDRRALITRNRSRLTGDRLFFFVNQGEVVFEDIRVRLLP